MHVMIFWIRQQPPGGSTGSGQTCEIPRASLHTIRIMPAHSGSSASSSTDIHVDALLSSFGKKIVSLGPKTGSKLEELPLEYLRGGGKASIDSDLKKYAKARIAICELADKNNDDKPVVAAAPAAEPESEAALPPANVAPGKVPHKQVDTFTPVKKVIKIEATAGEDWGALLARVRQQIKLHPKLWTALLLLLLSASMTQQLGSLGECTGLVLFGIGSQLCSGMRAFFSGFFSAFTPSRQRGTELRDIVKQAAKEHQNVHITLPAAEPVSALSKIEDFLDRIFTASIGAVCMFVYNRNHA